MVRAISKLNFQDHSIRNYGKLNVTRNAKSLGRSGQVAEPYGQLTAPLVLLALGLQRKSRGFSLADAKVGH